MFGALRSSSKTMSLLRLLASNSPITDPQKLYLFDELNSNTNYSQAFGLFSSDPVSYIETSCQMFQRVLTPVHSWASQKELDFSVMERLWVLWVPLARKMIEKYNLQEQPIIQGILGGQGTGKTTMAAALQIILSELGYATYSVSIDDFYKTYREREELKKVDPHLKWRGPPGTHDLELCYTLLKNVKDKRERLEFPAFDKSLYAGQGDRTGFIEVGPIQILLFEGWFVGVEPVPADQLDNPLIRDAQFSRYMNERLNEYMPVWHLLDSLIVLLPKDYRLSIQWRWEAEEKSIAQGKQGLTYQEVVEFVEYFWQSLHPLIYSKYTPCAEFLIDLEADHSPSGISSFN